MEEKKEIIWPSGKTSIPIDTSVSLENQTFTIIISFRISLRWPIHMINPVDKTKLSCYTSHRRSTTVSDGNSPPLNSYYCHWRNTFYNSSSTKPDKFVVTGYCIDLLVLDGNYGSQDAFTKEWNGMVKEIIEGRRASFQPFMHLRLTALVRSVFFTDFRLAFSGGDSANHFPDCRSSMVLQQIQSIWILW